MAIDNTRVKQYLLGTLSPEDKARFEDNYFTNHELFEEIEIAEDDLIDAYIRGELPPVELKRFEKNLVASSRLKDRVAFARTLAESTPEPKPAAVATTGVEPFWRRILFTNSPSPTRLPWAMAACTLLLLLGGGALLFEWNRLRGESRQLAQERVELEQQKQAFAREVDKQRSELNAQSANPLTEDERLEQPGEISPKEVRNSNPKNTSLAFLILPGTRTIGEGNQNEVVTTSTSRNVKLHLGLESDAYSSYSAVVKPVDGKPILTENDLKSRTRGSRKVVVLKIPKSQLSKGTYLIGLNGRTPSGTSEPITKYSFRVLKD